MVGLMMDSSPISLSERLPDHKSKYCILQSDAQLEEREKILVKLHIITA